MHTSRRVEFIEVVSRSRRPCDPYRYHDWMPGDMLAADGHGSSLLPSVLIRVHPWLTSVRNIGFELPSLGRCLLMRSRRSLSTSYGLRMGVPPLFAALDQFRAGTIARARDAEVSLADARFRQQPNCRDNNAMHRSVLRSASGRLASPLHRPAAPLRLPGDVYRYPKTVLTARPTASP